MARLLDISPLVGRSLIPTLMCWYPRSPYYFPPLTHVMKCSCVCRWRQEVSVVSSRRQQDVLWVALAAAGGAKWPGPPQCPAHLPHQRGHRSGKRCGQASGHSRQPRCHRQHPQDRQGGERRGRNGPYSVWGGNLVVPPVLDTPPPPCCPNCCYHYHHVALKSLSGLNKVKSFFLQLSAHKSEVCFIQMDCYSKKGDTSERPNRLLFMIIRCENSPKFPYLLSFDGLACASFWQTSSRPPIKVWKLGS